MKYIKIIIFAIMWCGLLMLSHFLALHIKKPISFLGRAPIFSQNAHNALSMNILPQEFNILIWPIVIFLICILLLMRPESDKENYYPHRIFIGIILSAVLSYLLSLSILGFIISLLTFTIMASINNTKTAGRALGIGVAIYIGVIMSDVVLAGVYLATLFSASFFVNLLKSKD